MLGVRDTLLARTQPLAIARLTIAPSALGDRAGITGAAAMVADVIFGKAAVDAEINSSHPSASSAQGGTERTTQ
jgi:hypothetical protein